MGLLNFISQITGFGGSKIVDTATLQGDNVVISGGIEHHINEIGTFEEYRQMRTGPTIALARAITHSAIRSADWLVESDDDVPEEVIKEYKVFFDGLRTEMLRNMMYSLDYGFQVIQIVWTIDDDGDAQVQRIKPIKPDLVAKINIFENTGKLASIVLEGGKVLEATEVVLVTYDSEGNDPFGRSRYENIRIYAWLPWKTAAKRCAQYMVKMAGVLPIIKYPMGENKTAKGETLNNSEIAGRMLDGLPLGKGIAIPTVLMNFAGDMKNSGAKIEDLMAWKVEFLDAKSGAGAEILDVMKHYESLQMRGLFVPERAAIEGSTGTKAEAEAHASVMIDTAQEDASGFADTFNKQLGDRWLVENFGESMRGKVRAKATAIADDRRAVLETILINYLNNPANIETVEQIVDFDALMDQADVPKREKVVDAAEPVEAPEAPAELPKPDPATVKLSRNANALARFMRKATAEV